MAKLYFRYGTVGSGKTMNLLAVAYNYRQQGKKVLIAKPELDTRFGKQEVTSRAGLTQDADLLLKENSIIPPSAYTENTKCILVDEAQFLSPSVIDQFRMVASEYNVPVICYGLRTDFRSYLFEGARRLMEIADSIEEMKTTCHFCNKKAVFNLKHVDGKAVSVGPVIDLGAEEKYFPACNACYYIQLSAVEDTDSVANA